LNNNRNNNNNNRRRGRGNNRGGGNPGQSNRIDSRARGNAPQMLDKYKKLAQEAQLNDDRVQTEYYLQFADHYFRVMADMKAVKDDQRPRRDGERDSDGGDYDDDDGDDGYGRQEERNQDRDDYRRDSRPRNDSQRNDSPRNDGQRRDEPRRDDSRRSEEPRLVPGSEGESGDQTSEDNPFTRDAPRNRQRPPREDRPRDDRPREDKPAAKRPRKPARAVEAEAEEVGLDPDMLPPSIARTLAADDSDDVAAEAPKPRRRLPPRRNRDEGSGDEALEAVG
jgi:hypothetical protein